MSRRRRTLAVAWALAHGLGACASKSPPTNATTPPPGEAPAAAGDRDFGAGMERPEAGEEAVAPTADEELAALGARVDQSWLELEALDDARAKAATAGVDPGDAAARCTRIHGLVTEICTLRDRLCTLATEHPGQSRYAEACTRSEETCSRARAAAERCPVG